MQPATSGKGGFKSASQLQGRTARAFSSNSLVKTMQMTVVIQYILTATPCLRRHQRPKRISELANLLYFEHLHTCIYHHTKISQGTSSFQSTSSCLVRIKFHSINDPGIFHAET